MIFITGDTHGHFDVEKIFSSITFLENGIILRLYYKGVPF